MVKLDLEHNMGKVITKIIPVFIKSKIQKFYFY